MSYLELCFAFNPSKSTHPESSCGSGALLKGLISVMVLKVEESAGHSLPHLQDSNPRPLGYQPDSLTIRPWLKDVYNTNDQSILFWVYLFLKYQFRHRLSTVSFKSIHLVL